MAAKFRVKELSLIGNELKNAGDIIELPEGTLPAENLEALDDEGKVLVAAYAASNEERIKKMREAHSTSGVGDPAEFMKLLKAEREADRADLATTVAKAVADALAAAFPNGMHKASVPPTDAE